MNDPKDLAIKWWRPEIDTARIKELARRSDIRGLVHSIGILSLWASTSIVAILLWRAGLYGWMVFALFVHGTFYCFSGSAFHELTHGTVFRSRWLNRLFLFIFAFLSLQNAVFFKESHRRHHACTLHSLCDGEVIPPKRYTLIGYLRIAFINPIAAIQQVLKIIRYSTGRIHGEWQQTCFPNPDASEGKMLIRWAGILLVGHLAIAGVAVWSGIWLLPVLITFGRFYGDWLHWPVNTTQHAGLRANVPDWRICSRTFYAGPLLRFLYWNMNYHIEHHTYAAVPFFRLAELHEAMKPFLPDPKPNLLAVWKEIIEVERRRRSGEVAFCETRIPKAS